MGRPSAGSVPINCSNNILLVRQSPCWYLSFPLELDNDVCHNVFSTYSKILSGFFLGLSRAKNTSDTIVDWKFFSFSSIRYMHVWDICVEIRATQKVGSGGNHNLDQSGISASFWNSQTHSVNDWGFPGIPVKNCIVGMLLSYPIRIPTADTDCLIFGYDLAVYMPKPLLLRAKSLVRKTKSHPPKN